MFDEGDPEMQQAYQAAQACFRYFWRELSWERRRIVPGLDMTMVKLPFTDGPRSNGNPEFEQMWIGESGFDADSISGNLLNSPNWLTSVREGDQVSVPFSHLTDWMMTADGRAYGGFTVNLMRSRSCGHSSGDTARAQAQGRIDRWPIWQGFSTRRSVGGVQGSSDVREHGSQDSGPVGRRPEYCQNH
jgi:uncharacterized protein YegJ (DUF2314 family)